MASVIKILLRLLALLPLPLIHGMGYMLGWLFFLVPNKRRSTTITNIKLCFPDMNAWSQWQLIRRSLLETSKGVLESSAMWMLSGRQTLRLLKGTSNEEYLTEAYNRGKGVILASPHLGMWEIIGLHCSSKYPMTSLYRPPPIAGLDSTMIHGRGRLGAKLVPTDASGVRAMYKALSDGELVTILPDQDPMKGQGVFAPFFGIQAKTMILLSRLANKTGATVLCVWAERLSLGRGYWIHYNRIDDLLKNNDLQHSVTILNQTVENCIRQKPEQYLWCYKRFRSRPDGQSRIYTR